MLRQADLLPYDDVVAVRPSTQVSLAGVGILDLVLAVETQSTRGDYWVEVKVDAGESGDQLARYRQEIAARPTGQRPTLFTLSRHGLGQEAGLPALTWLDLWKAIRTTTAPPRSWRDLARFLEEENMAAADDLPILTREAAALEDAWSLFRKAIAILHPVGVRANEIWPGSRYPGDETTTRTALANEFKGRGALMVRNVTNYKVGVPVGICSHDGESWLAVWVEGNPRTDVKVLEAADAAGLGDQWKRAFGSSPVLARERRLVDFARGEDASDWLSAALLELRAAGLLEVIASL